MEAILPAPNALTGEAKTSTTTAARRKKGVLLVADMAATVVVLSVLTGFRNMDGKVELHYEMMISEGWLNGFDGGVKRRAHLTEQGGNQTNPSSWNITGNIIIPLLGRRAMHDTMRHSQPAENDGSQETPRA
jgi:hypothetical protein